MHNAFQFTVFKILNIFKWLNCWKEKLMKLKEKFCLLDSDQPTFKCSMTCQTLDYLESRPQTDTVSSTFEIIFFFGFQRIEFDKRLG